MSDRGAASTDPSRWLLDGRANFHRASEAEKHREDARRGPAPEGAQPSEWLLPDVEFHSESTERPAATAQNGKHTGEAELKRREIARLQSRIDELEAELEQSS